MDTSRPSMTFGPSDRASRRILAAAVILLVLLVRAHCLSAPIHAAGGGPDAFGYTWDDTEPFNWIDATSGTELWPGECCGDWGTPLDIGFAFPFYGGAYSQLYAWSDGVISFATDPEEWPWPFLTSCSPNNFVAPARGISMVSAEDHAYFMAGGTAPNRYAAVAWHLHEPEIFHQDPIIVEAVLHENGDIVFQYLNVAAGTGLVAGIEDATGRVGLLYPDSSLHVGLAVRFRRPSPRAGVLLVSGGVSGLAVPGSAAAWDLVVRNVGSLGSDALDLSAASPWPIELFRTGDGSPLADTDGDLQPDTGSLAPGQALSVTARIRAPAGVAPGVSIAPEITARSSISASVAATSTWDLRVAAPFAHVYQTPAPDFSIYVDLLGPAGRVTRRLVGPWNYDCCEFRHGPVIAEIPGGFLVAWSYELRQGNDRYDTHIEYTLLDQRGRTVRAPATLALPAYDGNLIWYFDTSERPAIAVAPNGRIGLFWDRTITDPLDEHPGESRVAGAILERDGRVVLPAADLALSSSGARIAVTTDNRFVLVWDGPAGLTFAVRDSAGLIVTAPAALPWDTSAGSMALTGLSGGRVLCAWTVGDPDPGVDYAILDSAGQVLRPPARLADEDLPPYAGLDAAGLSGGGAIVAWVEEGSARVAALDDDGDPISTPVTLVPEPDTTLQAPSLSALPTGDGMVTLLGWPPPDRWVHGQALYYARVAADATPIDQPVLFRALDPLGPCDSDGLRTNRYGFASAPIGGTFGAVEPRCYLLPILKKSP